jgi:hypothetical protein
LPYLVTAAQETKAQQHLAQMALLARRLGRVLVLPNVMGGRYAVCRSQCVAVGCSRRLGLNGALAHSPYDFYHDPVSLSRLFNATVIQWPDFVAYAAQRAALHGTPTAQLVFIGPSKASVRCHAVSIRARGSRELGRARRTSGSSTTRIRRDCAQAERRCRSPAGKAFSSARAQKP